MEHCNREKAFRIKNLASLCLSRCPVGSKKSSFTQNEEKSRAFDVPLSFSKKFSLLPHRRFPASIGHSTSCQPVYPDVRECLYGREGNGCRQNALSGCNPLFKFGFQEPAPPLVTAADFLRSASMAEIDHGWPVCRPHRLGERPFSTPINGQKSRLSFAGKQNFFGNNTIYSFVIGLDIEARQSCLKHMPIS
jgi:hypothetical protein